jgi:hypothetical protein
MDMDHNPPNETVILPSDCFEASDVEVLNRIEEMILKDMELGFDPRALEILDDENASAQRINDIRQLISNDILSALFQIGSSFHYHKVKAGGASVFNELIMRLGTAYAKILILALALFSAVKDEKMKQLSARCFATSLLSGLFAQERKWKDRLIREAELMGLFIEIGKVIMLLYNHRLGELCPDVQPCDELFLERYNTYFGKKIVGKFGLPEFLYGVLDHPDYLSFDDESVTVPGLVFSTYCHVERSFRRHGKFVIQSVMPNDDGNPPATIGTFVQERFNAVGIGGYVDIKPVYLTLKSHAGVAYVGRIKV